MSESDRLFARPQEKIADFVFNEDVARVFPDMIKRSVPGYPTIVENLGVIAAKFAQPNTVLYDLGCSLGAVSQSLRRHVQTEPTRVIAVDNSKAMVERCREYMSSQSAMYEQLLPIEVLEADILSLDLQPTSVVALNFTLQFIEPEKRLGVLQKIHEALHARGVLLLSEKIRFKSPIQQELLNNLHIAFKRANGYSEMEIAQKRSALENVMLIDSIEAHKARLQEAGFSSVTPWFQCLNFVSFVALP
jgi:tRNA (cmo5U34)-methyltransferase